ncbi:hypothetical protein T440DRAFT_276189 [Plenodomus tracheiphilus IPT5]|uniref:MATH and UCH domain-containing protein n=1 Tax=Plenodomus tracheiphilus IPT5 TaxID=1408161 RepID=A0A6A7BGC9_9PLEO|nr:hypothetical protein T440DRAFT_276189 [Plenodomus tracheiphilus IPT5]
MAAVEQPHFIQRTPTPSFSSPLHHLDAQPASPSPPPPASADADMSSSITTSGQRHDREDAEMEDASLTNGQPQASPSTPSNREHPPTAIAVEVAAVDDNAMDTTPDADVELVLPNAPAGPQDAALTTPSSPAPNADSEVEASSEAPNPLAAIADDAILPVAIAPPVDPDVPVDPTAQPPPPPPPIEPVPSDSESSDDDDGLPSWHPIQEDTSSPDEDELKELEESTEHSALDHEYWESKAFLPLEEPEYTAGETGRIDWTIDAYNGTREKPNRDLVMKSDIVTIGGHQWQIKFYPKGNDSDYLSVYLECLSVMKPKDEKDEDKKDEESSKEAAGETIEEEKESDGGKVDVEGAPEDASAPLISIDAQHTPLPLLGSKQMPKRKCVAAQVSVVLYNPTEPRVHYSKTALHRFCSGSPDWGWTRFHGPYYDIAHRMRGQRQALLHQDKLAFTGYVRIVEDETNCLWEHPNRENPWDSFAMTGLQGLMLGEDASAPGGNMISAIASWMLFKPFRHLLYSVKAPDVYREPLQRPKPLINALQKVLYMLRTQVEPGAGAIALDDVLNALEWYGIHERLDKLDVIETWEVLRLRLEEELADTEHAATLEALYGPKRDYSVGIPSYRVPVVGVASMQQAIDKSPDFTVSGQPLPELLTIEMERQTFDLKTRSYVKVLNKVTLDDHVKVNGIDYTLYGFVVHKQTLQSYVYQPILRPEGPGSRWYSYSDSKEENQVKCLTKRQAIDAHEGKPGAEKIVGNDAVAYIAMYVRDDVKHTAFTVHTDSEEWAIPNWILAEFERSKRSDPSPTISRRSSDEPSATAAKDTGTETEKEPVEELHFQVYDSRLFAQHDGPGVLDVYDPKYQKSSDLVKTVTLSLEDGCKEVREKLVTVFEGVQDPRQLKFWFLDSIGGALGRPNLLGVGKIEYSSGTYERYSDPREWSVAESRYTSRIWVHVIDFDKLPELPKEDEKETSGQMEAEAINESQTSPVADTPQVESANVENGTLEWETLVIPAEVLPQSEDTPMSEPDEPTLQQPAPSEVDPAVPPQAAVTDGQDIAMVEDGFGFANASSAIDPLVPVPDPVLLGDTEMGGTQDDLPPPPPPPMDIPVESMQPPAPVRAASPEPPPDEIYFFLKFWNPETQTLEPRGSHIALKSDQVNETVMTLLSVAEENRKKARIWEEEELSTTRSIKHGRSFSQADLHNTSIIIVGLELPQPQRDDLASRAAFSDPQPYLACRSFARNFPHKLNGHFTYNYFSSESYKGEIKSGHRHGHGTLIYHSGATYTGTFRLNQRHGHGLHIFQNGDTYDGSWVADAQHGTGTFIEAATCNTYVGGWQANKKFGEGVTHWKSAQEAERLCRICWDEDADSAFYDCGHVVACLGCAREVQVCPVCRKRVVTVLKLWYVA